MKAKRSKRTRVRKSKVTRRRAARRGGGTGGWVAAAAVTAGVLALATTVGVVGTVTHGQDPGQTDQASNSPIIVFDAPTANSDLVPVSGDLRETLIREAHEHGSVRLVEIGGDGAVLGSQSLDLTPRLPNGDPIKVQDRADEETAKTIDDTIYSKINNTSPGRPAAGQALFLGLEHLEIGSDARIYALSSLLDTTDPLDLRRLGWEVPAREVAESLRTAGELPNLTGADITFIVRPVAGDQDPLRPAQVQYRESLWRAIVTTAGASSVRFEYPDGSPPPAGSVAIPTVPVPPPPTTPVPVTPNKCKIATGTYFKSNSAQLLDRDATRNALRECAERIGPSAKVTVVGHTAGSGNTAFAVRLSRARAQVIAELLHALGVPAGHIQAAGAGSRHQPYPDPWDPRNRTVLITFTT